MGKTRDEIKKEYESKKADRIIPPGQQTKFLKDQQASMGTKNPPIQGYDEITNLAKKLKILLAELRLEKIRAQKQSPDMSEEELMKKGTLAGLAKKIRETQDYLEEKRAERDLAEANE